MKDVKDILLKYLFPPFRNKITWLVVLSGLSLVSSPLIEQVLKFILNSNFNLNITDGNDSVVGLALVSVGLVYHFVSEGSLSNTKELSYDKKNRDLTHDIEVYEQISQVLDVSALRLHVESILNNHSYLSDEDDKFLFFYHNGDKVEYDLINNLINQRKNNLYKSLSDFTQFKYANFDPNREGSDRRYLYPRGNVDLSVHVSDFDDKKYDSLALELNSLGDKLIFDCDEFRMSLKRELGI